MSGISLLIVAALAGCGCGPDAPAVPVVSRAWIRAAPPSHKVAVAYAVVENPTNREFVLLAAETEIAGAVEIHEMVHEADLMRMKRIESLKIPPGSRVALEPGGLHLMLIDLKKELREGDTVPLLLRFEERGQKKSMVHIEAIVRRTSPESHP